jgi:hypothetical protein
VKRLVVGLAVAALALLFLGSAGQAASATPARYQLRGHLPELGERPTTRVFLTQAAYDAYRTSLGDANVFPPASSLFMSFDKDILALYTRGNDTGGRCIATPVLAAFSGDTLTASLTWQAGTCGAPSTAHYPFILMSIARTSTDGTAWLQSARSVCAVLDTQETSACASLASASPSPAPTASPSPSPTAAGTSSPSPSPSPTRSLTPTQTVAAASPTPSAAPTAAATASRSPVAAATTAPAASDDGTNYLLYAMLVAIAFLVLLSLVLSRSGGSRRR